MINLVRKIVAGPKNRTVDEEYDLDLTYITDRIIAMAFPAAGFEKTYRNSIDDVSKFLKQKHGEQFLIINASNRKYQYAKFDHQVMQYFWTDHQAPPLTTLFQVGEKIERFLFEDEKNVVIVHCNHGKGRTGTAIISYLLYSRQFNNVKDALEFYNAKRFVGKKYGVDRPCQLRYLNYFQSILELSLKNINVPLRAYKLSRVSQKGIKDKQLFIRIFQTRTEHIIYPEISLEENLIKFSRPLIGDISIELLQSKWAGYKQLYRINFNMFFLTQNQETHAFQVIFKDTDIKYKESTQNFEFSLEFEVYCGCHKYSIHKQSNCLCHVKRIRQQTYWDFMCKMVRSNRKRRGLNQQNPNLQNEIPKEEGALDKYEAQIKSQQQKHKQTHKEQR